MSEPIQDLPEQLGDHDCPICFEPDAIRDREAVCPNGHKLCADCQPRVQSVWVHRTQHAACPLCRAPIPYIRDPALPDYVGPQPQAPRAPRVHAVQQRDADGRRGDPERPQRAIDAFNNIPARRAAQQQFRENRNAGTIPQNARFGGFHQRNCTCGRRGGPQGVRFLRLPDGTRRYRCEVCYEQAGGGIPPEPPAWNTPAVAMHNDCTV
jgi:hypothetical protein